MTLIAQTQHGSTQAPQTGGPILSCSGLHKSFGQGPAAVHVLRGLDLAVQSGEFLAVMGPSGCGKSTLLHTLGLMTGVQSGQVTLAGVRVDNASESARCRLRRTQIGFVFQRFNLLGMLTARENIDISLHVRGIPAGSRAMELLGRLGVEHLAGRKPGKMSIGQQQRVAVARALAHSPAVLLADEPTGNLDSASAAALLDLLKEVNVQSGQTIVMITHSSQAAATAGRTVHMKDGRIADPE
jgi:putative ABC transport system ATP-binding protein